MKRIAIFGVPRSGTSWLGQIFNSAPYVAYRYQPIFSYSFPSKIFKDSSSSEIELFYKELLATKDSFVCQLKNVSGNETPEFEKTELTHLVWKEVRYIEVIENLIVNSDTKIVGIVRHPCGVINSWQKAPKEFDLSWKLADEWRFANKKNENQHDYYGFEKWLEFTNLLIYLKKKYPDRIVIVKYEDLLEDPNEVIEGIFDFSDMEFTDQTRLFIKNSTSSEVDDPYSVFRNQKKSRDWEGSLDIEIIEAILSDKRFIKVYNEL